MRGARIAVEEGLHIFVDHRVARQQRVEPVQLAARGELPVDEQVGRFRKGRALGQLLNRVAPVAEDALVPVNEGDGTDARSRVHVAVIERDAGGLLAESRDVNRFLVLRARDDRQGDGLPSDRDGGGFRGRRWDCIRG